MNWRWVFYGSTTFLGALLIFFKYPIFWPASLIAALLGVVFFIGGLIKEPN